MIYIARNRLYVLTGCSWKFGSNNEAIHTVSICRVYEEPVPAVINGLSISWVTESCWVGWLSGWTLRWSEAVPVRQPGDWYLCPYLSEKFVWAVSCTDFDDSRMQFATNMDEVCLQPWKSWSPDMRPDLRLQSLNDLVGRCEHATQAQRCLFENLVVVTHATGESLTIQCRRCRA